jgi:polar amino acid transport system substrate-binding protein
MVKEKMMGNRRSPCGNKKKSDTLLKEDLKCQSGRDKNNQEVNMQFIFLVLAIALTLPNPLFADSRITIATADGIPLSTPVGTGFHDQVVREAFKRIGLQMEVVHLPAERALLNADQGIEDGVYVRVEGLDQVYKNLRIVPEKITEYEFVAFGKNPQIQLNGWDSLENYYVGIITGWKILEHNVIHFKELTKIKNAELLFKALCDDKVDLVVYNKLDGYGTIKELGLKGVYALEKPLATKAMFLYLHKDREGIIPQLTDALKSMKSDGTYEAIKTSVLTPYMPE